MKYLMDLIYIVAAAGYSPVIVYRRLKYGRYRTGWQNRFGKIIRKHPDKKCIWIHAVSVGEVNATRTIVDELSKKFSQYEILITTTTDTGYSRANALYGSQLQVYYFPLDISWIMRRAFSAIRPAVCILMELEVWPNFAQRAAELNIPIVVANGRVTERSMKRYGLVKPFVKKMFENISCILAQTEQYAERFRQLGCAPGKVIVTGSLKYDTAQITNKVEGADTIAKELNIGSERLWVAGGTGNDEETIILDVYKKLREQEEFADVLLAIVPRKPERFDEVAQLIKQNGFELLRYSEIKKKATEDTENTKKSIINNQLSINTVVLGDTMGDLRKLYSLATVVFVGRSLVPMGGSDMMEAAALGKCTIFGPHAFNFKQTVDALLADNGAILVNNADELYKAVQKSLLDDNFRKQTAQNGQQVIRKNQGATEKTLSEIARLLDNCTT